MASINFLWIVITCLCSYLLGSIPFSVWIGYLAKGNDLRTQNVGNPGGMNAVMTYGIAIGLPIILLDFIKGAITIALIDHIFSIEHFISQETNHWHTIACIFGPIFCIIGHNYSIFLKFNGGQGVGVYMGVTYYINPLIPLFYNVAIIAFMSTRKINIRYATLVILLLQVILIMVIPIHPPWSQMHNNEFIWNTTFLQLKQGLVLLAMGLTLLIRMIQSIIMKKQTSTWRLGSQKEQVFNEQ